MSGQQFKLLYDGACPFCVREVRWLRRRDRHGRLAFEDITAPGFNPAIYGATPDEVMGVIHGVFPDGRLVRRVEVFREAYRAIGWGWLVAPMGWPVLRVLFDLLYGGFARNRVRLGRWFGRGCVTGQCGVVRGRSDLP